MKVLVTPGLNWRSDSEGLLMRALSSAITTDGSAPPDGQRTVSSGPAVTYELLRQPLDPATLAALRLAPACECTH